MARTGSAGFPFPFLKDDYLWHYRHRFGADGKIRRLILSDDTALSITSHLSTECDYLQQRGGRIREPVWGPHYAPGAMVGSLCVPAESAPRGHLREVVLIPTFADG